MRTHSLSAGVLAYLVPGLGHLSQGRWTKGLFFFFALYSLFFYGMQLDSWKNVYIVRMPGTTGSWSLSDLATNLYNRPQFVGQFWMGLAAWPAIWQYNDMPTPSETRNPFLADFERAPPESELKALQTAGDKSWDLGWVFTVIAGMLNVLVIYDAAAGPAFEAQKETPRLGSAVS